MIEQIPLVLNTPNLEVSLTSNDEEHPDNFQLNFRHQQIEFTAIVGENRKDNLMSIDQVVAIKGSQLLKPGIDQVKGANGSAVNTLGTASSDMIHHET